MSEFGKMKSEGNGFRNLSGEASENQDFGNPHSESGQIGNPACTGEAIGNPNGMVEAAEIQIAGTPPAPGEAPAFDLNPEFTIVGHARNLLKPRHERIPGNEKIQTRNAGSKRNMSESSRRDYLKIGARLHAVRETDYDRLPADFFQEQTQTKNGFYTKRAAYSYWLETTLEVLLREAGAAQRAIKTAVDVTAAVQAYKRVVEEIRNISEDLEVVRRMKPAGAFDPTDPRRRRLCGLLENWVDLMVRGAYGRRYTDQVATVALTGCRSGEVARGVIITIEADLLKCRIIGKKVTDQSGQPWREQLWTIEGEAARYLARRVREEGGRLVVSAPNGRAVEDAIRNLSRRVFPELKKPIIASSFRNQLSANLKADGYSADDIARALGHLSDETSQHYGVRQQGRSGRAWLVAVTAARPVKAKKHERIAKLRVAMEQGMKEGFQGRPSASGASG